ncbi:MAG: 8-amino-7-oxononanoate synthase [Nitrospirae bacterium]|nr:8-amino-7-oxononanoate synthase [Nitrospirota bacterium]
MFSDELKRLKQDNLVRHIKDREANKILPEKNPHRALARIWIGGNEYINFASNDYLGLACNASIIDAAKKAMDEYGFGSGASRLLSGGAKLHNDLERMTAEFKDTEAALAFNSGYTANISAIPSLAGKGDVIFSDELNHASIIDGCRLSRAKTIIYRHRDTGHLTELMENEKGNRKMVITDSVFSMDGDIAPLKEIYDLCLQHNRRNNTLLYIDDAHGTGVLGEGKGALRHFNIKPEPWIIQMGTFSKALGSYGAFIAAGRDIIDWLINTGRGFIYATALPACVIAASIEALQILRDNPELVSKLWQNRERLLKGIRDLGFDTLNSETPIIPIIPPLLKGGLSDIETTMKFSEHLLKRHIYAPAIKPPTVRAPRIRITVTAAHTEKDIEALLDALSEAKL